MMTRAGWGGRGPARLGWLVAGVLLPVATSCAPGGATGGGALTVTIDGGASQVAAEGDAVTLSASAEGGTTPYAFRWSQERGESVLPGEADLAQATVTTLPVEVQGEYSFRVTAVDAGMPSSESLDAFGLPRGGPAFRAGSEASPTLRTKLRNPRAGA